MHIIENYFDVCGFDHRLVQGGTSVYLWNLSRALAGNGHRVSVVSPAHGRLDDIRAHHEVTTLPYVDEYTVDIPLDAQVWQGFGSHARITVRTTAHRAHIDGVELYFLSNEMLDALSDTFYPPYHTKGRDLVFFKPLIFQVDSVRFMRRQFAGERAIVHLHEPFYHYLVPAAFREDPTKLVASTVQSNMPITKMVYRPEVDALLDFLEAPPHGVAGRLPAPRDNSHLEPWHAAMRQYQQLTHLHYEYPPDHVAVFELIAEHADLIGYLSPGQQEFTATFADTPFEQLFCHLDIAATVRATAHKRFVAGCALSDSWLAGDPATVDRNAVLGELGLDPTLTTFYHNARYAVHHKGQVELMRAIDRALGDGLAANFIVRCLSNAGIDNPYFHDVARRHQGRVHLEWLPVAQDRLFAYAASSDFCLFPSKFEMDTFLIAQGEAMACGAVPIASAQLGMAHFGQVADPIDGPDRTTATGFSVRRSFAEDDALLVAELVDRIRFADSLRRDRPQEYDRLRANAIATARQFTWQRCVEEHLAAFEPLHRGSVPALPVADALRNCWFDLLDPDAWRQHGHDIAERAAELGDIDVYAQVAPLSPQVYRLLFDAAYRRADFARCERIAALAPDAIALPELAALRERCQLRFEPGPPDSAGSWRVRYRMPYAQRVEAVIASSTTAQRGTVTVHPLKRGADDTFEATVDGTLPPRLALLLTLDSGRVTWDLVGESGRP